MEPCCLCGSGSWEDIAVESDQGKLLRCAGCGLVALAGGSRRVELLNLESYSEGAVGAFPDDMDAEFAKWAAFRLEQLLEVRPAIRKIAELGSGTGHFLEAAENKGFFIKGFDLADHRRRAKGAPFEAARDVLARLGRMEWDAVAAFHVLEHVPHPVEAVAAILEGLNGEGVAVVEVPGILDELGPSAGSIDRRHLWYYSEATMRKLVERAGGRVLKVSRVGPSSADLESMSRAGAAITRSWSRLKGALPAGCINGLRTLLRPHRSRLIHVLAEASGTKSDNIRMNTPLNLCVFFCKEGGRD